MKINGVEIDDLDIFDLETAEKCDKALNKVIEKTQSIGNKSVSESIRIQCTAVFECFNTIFGDGTDKKIFGDKVNLLVCLKAFEELAMNIDEQKKGLSNIVNKYSPNRVQRRSKKK